MLTKDHAEAIAKKLNASFQDGSKHPLAIIEYEGRRIGQFGIRRGSRRDQGHDHIPSSIHVRPRDALLLAQCPMSLEDWIKQMKDKGFIAST
jgi:hypothetical protein